MSYKKTIHIFLSSPHDVNSERLIAKRVIERLSKEYSNYFELIPILWEREPLIATKHFQSSIIPPFETDLVIVVVWSRLGTQLPQNEFQGAITGKKPITGTEWEFEDAYYSYQQKNKPDLLLYRKHAEITANLNDEKELEEKQHQKKLVDDFFNFWTKNQQEDTFKSAFHVYKNTTEFEEKVEIHLRSWLEEKLKINATEIQNSNIRWHKGSPFLGLKDFEIDHSPIFFGRMKARNELRELLIKQIDHECAFLLVLGASGSGKSSLVKAGLLPDLIMPGMIDKVGLCRYGVMRPSQGSANPLFRLGEVILSKPALPELKESQYTPKYFEKLFIDAPTNAIVPIRQGLELAANKSRLTQFAEAKLILVIDQLEELFTLIEITQDKRKQFIRCLKVLSESGIVWIIATMRSDYFELVESEPDLLEISKGDRCYLLTKPKKSEVRQMVQKPAQEAGITYEVNSKTGLSLDELIIEATCSYPSALPLMEFTLEQLWQLRSKERQLTFKAYNFIGGLEGAIGQKAEQLYLHESERINNIHLVLANILKQLVTVGQGADVKPTARSVKFSKFKESSNERILVEAMLKPDARLLLADKEGADAIIRITHEAFLTHWPRARDQIEIDRIDLQTRARLEEACSLWLATSGKDKKSLLLRHGRPLNEAVDLLDRSPDVLNSSVQKFIIKSATSYKSSIRRKLSLGILAVFIFAVIATNLFFYSKKLREYQQSRFEEANRTDISGTLQSFAASPGGVASDGNDGKNGLYTEALLKFIRNERMNIVDVLLKTHQYILDKSKKKQRPWFSNTLTGNLFLHDPPKNRHTVILVIGNSNYKSSPLKAPGNDAKDIASQFRKMGYSVNLYFELGRKEIREVLREIANAEKGRWEKMVNSGQRSIVQQQSDHEQVNLLNAFISNANASISFGNKDIVNEIIEENSTKRQQLSKKNHLENSMIIIYLAGHGIQINGVSYFIPIDASIASEEEVKDEAISLDLVYRFASEHFAAGIFLFDIGRNNPFSR